MIGYFINEISGIPSFVIDGANHVAYTHNKGKDFLQVYYCFVCLFFKKILIINIFIE